MVEYLNGATQYIFSDHMIYSLQLQLITNWLVGAKKSSSLAHDDSEKPPITKNLNF